MEQINFGFVGAGQVAHGSAAQVNRNPRARVLAAHDLHPERLQDLCEKQKIERSYDDPEKLFADPDIDAVYIAVPNKFHASLAIAALQAGKHVLLDKPFALNLEEARQVAAAARKAGKSFSLGMNMRFGEDQQRARTLVADGTLGEVYHAKTCWFRRSGIPKLGTWFGNRELAGGGCLLDIGVHMLDACLYILDQFDPILVSGSTYTKFGNRGLGEGGWGLSDRSDVVFDVDDFTSAFIKMRDGTSISLDVAWACHIDTGNRNGMELYGTEAGATLYPLRLIQPGKGKGEYHTTEMPDRSIRFPHRERFTNFINHLLGEEELCVTMRQALVVQQILDAIAKSASTGQAVSIDEPADTAE